MRPSLPSTSGFTAPGVIIYKGHSENSVSEGRVTFSTILGTPLWSSVERPSRGYDLGVIGIQGVFKGLDESPRL